MVMHHHKPEGHTEMLMCQLQGQGHSEGLCYSNMAVSVVLSADRFASKLNLMVRLHKPECLVRKLDCCVQGQGHSEGSKCQWMFIQPISWTTLSFVTMPCWQCWTGLPRLPCKLDSELLDFPTFYKFHHGLITIDIRIWLMKGTARKPSRTHPLSYSDLYLASKLTTLVFPQPINWSPETICPLTWPWLPPTNPSSPLVQMPAVTIFHERSILSDIVLRRIWLYNQNYLVT